MPLNIQQRGNTSINIDFHSHILPGADHGSDGLETSLDMVRRAQEAGIGIVVATPHFYPARDSFARFEERRRRCVHRLTEALCGTDAPQLLIGAEVHACEGLEHLEELEQLCVQGTRTLLLEMPFSAWTKRLYHTVDALRTERGMDVVLAHIERYPVREMEELMEELELKAQVNAAVLCMMLKKRRILRLIEDGWVYALGSDAHGRGAHYAEYAKALRVLGAQREPLMARTAELLRTAAQTGSVPTH